MQRPPQTEASPALQEASLPPTLFDRELLEKYDRPAPRYTSYPTALHFTEVGAEVYRRLLAERQTASAPLSLYLHVPFCRTRCFFCGCHVSISQSTERSSRYLESLQREFLEVLEAGASGRVVSQIHWGGGTPNFLPADDLRTLGSRLRADTDWSDDFEFGVEIDPRRLTEDQLDALAEVGVNRLSLGVQDTDHRVQMAINRVQSPESIRSVIGKARDRGIESLNIDLIYGLPHQSVASFDRTLEAIREFDPDRIALFNFAYLPEQIPHQRAIDAAAMPTPGEKLSLFELAIHRLGSWGYDFIGLDHFAKWDDSLSRARRAGTMTRNFQGYSTQGDCDLIALGNSAIGQLGDHYLQNVRSEIEYGQRITAGDLATARGVGLDRDDRIRRAVIHELLCHLRIEKAHYGQAHGIDFDRYFAPSLRALEPMLRDGLVTDDSTAVVVTPAGRFALRNAAMAFDRYANSSSGKLGYSRAV